MNDRKQSFKDLVRTCLQEVKEEKAKKEQIREALKKYVRKVLNEVISGPSAQEPDEEEVEKINKGYAKDGNQPATEAQDEQVQQLTRLVHGINADFNVYRDTKPGGGYTSGKRNFIIIDAGDLFSVRIKERWENNFDIEAFVREQDRVIAIGLNWAQLKAFIKANFGEVAKTYVSGAKEKSVKNSEDQVPKRDSDLPDTSIPTKKISNEPAKLGDEEAKDQVKKKEDKPDQPMKAVTKPGKDPESKNKAKDNKETPQVKPPKHDNDKELVKKMPGKKRN